jgi:hypothetical protein
MSLAPSSGRQGGGTSVVITGTNFTNPSAVKFGTKPATSVTFTSATSLTAVCPSGAGTVAVTVTTPGGTANVGTFIYVGPPTLSDLNESVGKAADTVVISGATLATVLSLASTPPGVTFGAVAAATLGAHNDSSITVTAPAGTGTVPITVNTTGGGADSLSFTYLAAPTVTAADPDSGPEVGGNIVTVTGTGLAYAASATIDGASANFGVISDTQVAIAAPPGTGEDVDIVVTTPGGTGTGTGLYSYIPAPG